MALKLVLLPVTMIAATLILSNAAETKSCQFYDKASKLPEKIVVGYASWNECDQKLVEAVKQGVNVLIWFSINLVTNTSTGTPLISGGPDLECVKSIMHQINDLGLQTVHLISIGGWNSPHPDTTNSPEIVYEAWKSWNNGLFDGFDWDIEGNDDPGSIYNHFTIDCLDMMGRLSQLAKQDGYIVSMAPAESYLDPTTSVLDLDLNHSYPEWQELVPGFNYHGHNVYAYLLLNFGSTLVPSCFDGPTAAEKLLEIDTFDFITVQLYEGYSHAQYNVTIQGEPAAGHIARFAQSMYAGWELSMEHALLKDKATEERLGLAEGGSVVRRHLSIPPERLVVGLSNGWAGDGKFFLAYPDEVAAAYHELEALGQAPRGFAFWDIADEGSTSPLRPDEPVWMAAGLDSFLHTRTPSSAAAGRSPTSSSSSSGSSGTGQQAERARLPAGRFGRVRITRPPARSL